MLSSKSKINKMIYHSKAVLNFFKKINAFVRSVLIKSSDRFFLLCPVL